MVKTAKCNRTGTELPLNEGFFVGNPHTGEWQFISKDALEQSADYCIAVQKLVRSPEAFSDRMGQLAQKKWLNPTKFFEFFERFRKDNDLHNAL